MKLTRNKAIELCIELWTWLAETGKRKKDWPGWEKYGSAMSACWFCEYDDQMLALYKRKGRHACGYCPLKTSGVGKCGDTFFEKWNVAGTPKDRKKYAKLFLEQIRKLK